MEDRDAEKPPVQDNEEREKVSVPTSAPFKFSLSGIKQSVQAASNSQAKKHRDEIRKEYITAMGEGGVEPLDKNIESGPKVIPKQENRWRLRKQAKFLPSGEIDPLSRPEERFEMETIAAGADQNVQYGLTVMRREGGSPASETQNLTSLREMEAQRLKEDLAELPDEAELDDYEAMPIEEFGAAMLRGMGWKAGAPVGRNGSGLVTPVEYVPRPDRLGLGATPKTVLAPEKKIIKPGESREPKPDLVVPSGPDGRVRNVKRIDEKLVERVKEGVQVGKLMFILHGKHKGLCGEVLSIENQPSGSNHSDRATIRLNVSEEIVSVRLNDLGEIDHSTSSKRKQHDRNPRKSREVAKEENYSNINFNASDKHSFKHDDRGGSDDLKSNKGAKAVVGYQVSSSSSHWLIPHIRVRVISKEFARGRLYLKKATVVDLTSPSVCDVIVDNSREIIQSVNEDVLETVVPKKGGRVIVVLGKHRGRIGKLIDRNSDSQTAIIQMAESFDLCTLSMDHVAEYSGEAEDYDS